MSNTDDPDQKPPPQKTVEWDPKEVPGLSQSPPPHQAATPASPAAAPPAKPTPPSGQTPPATGETPPARPPTTAAPPPTRPPATPATPPAATPPAQGTPPPPPAAPDPSATVKWSPEEVARVVKAEAAAAQEADAEEDRLIGTLIRDKWKVLKRLGAGSFGTVYKVQDIKGGWIEALKILGVDRLTGAEAEETRARFLREAQIMKRLGQDSQHIVGIGTYEEDFDAGLIYFLMEFVEGRSLAAALNEGGPFSVERTIAVALQVCDALMAAHEGPEPVVHRDLKLENLMLTKDRSGDEMVKVLDFGIAKIAERDADSRLTTVGTLGTPGYAAPEQLRAESVDGRTDLFAFGVILYALLTGRDPWLGNLAHEPTHQIYELMVATDRAQVRPIHEAGVAIPPAMVNVVMKLLRRDPAQRFQSARELRDALKHLAEGGVSSEASTLCVATEEPGVGVEIRSGRTVVAEGPTPCTAEGIAPGTYSVHVRDPAYEETETTVILGAGAIQDLTIVATKRDAPSKAKARPKARGKARGRIVAALILILGLAGVGYAQPWGRTLDEATFWDAVEAGSISGAWFTDGGIEGGYRIAPDALADVIPALATVLMPFHVSLSEGEVPDAVARLRSSGASVDVAWEIRRLTELAVLAQARQRYFGLEGGDVRSYALRLMEMDPESLEAASLLRKVGERMAWDAEAALQDGPPERAAELIEQCLDLVPDHPRCMEIFESL